MIYNIFNVQVLMSVFAQHKAVAKATTVMRLRYYLELIGVLGYSFA